MLGLFYFVRGGKFYNTFDQCTEIDFGAPSKIEREGVPWPLMAAF
jgi:hypothetical protein